MNTIDIKTSPAFKTWWFALPASLRRTLSVRSAVAGFNAAQSLYGFNAVQAEQRLQAEYDDQAGASL